MSGEASIKTAELVMLGLLAERDNHAYGLSKIIDERELRTWTRVSLPSIYRVLRILESRGMLTSGPQASESGRPARRSFSLEDSGRRALGDKLLEILSTVTSDQQLVGLALMFSPTLEVERVSAALRQRMAGIDSHLEELSPKRSLAAAQYRHTLIDGIFAREILLLEADRRWARDLVERLQAEHRKN